MKRFWRIPVGIAIIAALVLAPFPLPEIYGEEEGDLDVQPAMLVFSEAVLGIQKALASGDAGPLSVHARALKKAAEEVPDLRPGARAVLVRAFDQFRADIDRLSSELVASAREEEYAAGSQVVGEIRHTCISCHVKFRVARDESGLFPNQGNLITGEVRILKLDGKERIDRSKVVVFLDRVERGTGFPLPRKNPVVSQKDRCFMPRVLPVVKGTTVDFPNDDTIFHNVFSLSRTGPFDLDIYPPEELRSITFSRTGWVKVYCNIHPDMIAHIIVLESPFFALTDQEGFFFIPDVPDGKYTLRAWHEFGQEVRKEVEVFGASLHPCILEIQEDRKFVQHKNKFGKPYRGKYR